MAGHLADDRAFVEHGDAVGHGLDHELAVALLERLERAFVALERVIAQIDVSFSNSMIEAWIAGREVPEAGSSDS